MNDSFNSPGTNDNMSGVAGALETAQMLSSYAFPTSIVYSGLSGEEQGLFSGRHMAMVAREDEWDVVGVLDKDMIGNLEGVDEVIDNRTFRVISEPTPVTETEH